MAIRSGLINVMTGAAIKAARALRRDFGEVEQLQVSLKGPADFVSAADLKAERTLIAELTRARPRFGVLAEEGEPQPGIDIHHRWIIDPLDGTTNFLHGIPHFAISIALERDGEIIAGVIYSPLNDEMFWAEKGQGAWLNDRRLRVSARRNLADALFATGIPWKGREGHDSFLSQLRPVIVEVAGIRRFGVASLDLAWVAAGRFDGFWESNLKPWDIAAGVILVREAGGQVTDMDGGSAMLQTGSLIATNGVLHHPLADLLRTPAAASALGTS